MDIFTKAFWLIAIALTVISLVKDKNKTFAAMKKSKGRQVSVESYYIKQERKSLLNFFVDKQAIIRVM